jgi:hypothetical protein
VGFLGKLKEKVTPPNVHVTVALKKQFFSLGENLEGTVRILPGEEVGCDEIRCEIACIERVRKVKRVYSQSLKREVRKFGSQPSSSPQNPSSPAPRTSPRGWR